MQCDLPAETLKRPQGIYSGLSFGIANAKHISKTLDFFLQESFLRLKLVSVQSDGGGGLKMSSWAKWTTLTRRPEKSKWTTMWSPHQWTTPMATSMDHVNVPKIDECNWAGWVWGDRVSKCHKNVFFKMYFCRQNVFGVSGCH